MFGTNFQNWRTFQFEMEDFYDMSATAIDRATHSGYLLKAPQGVGKAQNRFCVLDGNLLHYYESEDPDTAKGFFLIERASIMATPNKDKPNDFPFCIRTCSTREIYLSAATAELRDTWVSNLQRASISNKVKQILDLKKKVADLERTAERQRSHMEAELKQTQRDLLAGLEAAEAKVTKELQSSLDSIKTTAKGLKIT